MTLPCKVNLFYFRQPKENEFGLLTKSNEAYLAYEDQSITCQLENCRL